MTDTWRLLIDPPADGATNMAIDDVITVAVAERQAPPTVRFYQWRPPCLSIGSLQAVRRAVAEPIGEPGRDWVRRPTGGRAVWHADDVTYAVIAPGDHPLVVGGVTAAYRRIASALATGLQRLGVDDVAVAPAGVRRDTASPACFDAASDYEIVVNGRKMIGSAQLRRAGAVLQHGSVPIHAHLPDLVARLPLRPEARERLLRDLAAGVAALADVLPSPPSPADVIAALVDGFRARGLHLEPGGRTASEAALLPAAVDRYRSWDWNARR
ncbi:MAG: lipoate--protein ligase family protein [Dehalococcoidia bacterium]|nr:lipoate--protein ligase family protein [Dehalococcoidia bacterium]